MTNGPSRGDPLDCKMCGACWVHGGEVTVATDGDRGVPKHLTRSVHGLKGYFSDDYLDYRRMAWVPLADDAATTRCGAFAGDVGRTCRCRIYDRRPTVCREFEPGSADCREARRIAALS